MPSQIFTTSDKGYAIPKKLHITKSGTGFVNSDTSFDSLINTSFRFKDGFISVKISQYPQAAKVKEFKPLTKDDLKRIRKEQIQKIQEDLEKQKKEMEEEIARKKRITEIEAEKVRRYKLELQMKKLNDAEKKLFLPNGKEKAARSWRNRKKKLNKKKDEIAKRQLKKHGRQEAAKAAAATAQAKELAKNKK